MLKTIEVYCTCSVGNENITKSVPNREVTLSVTSLSEEGNGFINYSLAIDDCQVCCEQWGTVFIPLDDRYDLSNVYVSKIEHDIELPNSPFEKYLESIDVGVEDTNFIMSVVYGEGDMPLALGIVYNNHNGYYAHTVYSTINATYVDCV